MENQNINIQYFKGLDTLRAVASLIVVWSHLELIKKRNDLPNLHDAQFWFMPGGHIAVVLFFVLSGFLITYLLLKEIEKYGEISLKKFYMRRVLRIWPLYYIIIFLSFLFFKPEYNLKQILLCLSFFPNVASAIGEGWSYSPQIWSIGVEEQFYLLWPILITIIKPKKRILYLSVFFAVYTLLPGLLYLININTIQSGNLANFFSNFFYGTKFNCLAIGCIIGIAVGNNLSWTQYFKNNYITISLIVLSVFLTFSKIRLVNYNDEFFSILYGCMILSLVKNDNINIDSKIFVFLGKISYGIYMYHWIVILLIINFLPKIKNLIIYNILLYILAFGFTILISWLSFISIEKYFLSHKKKFETK